VSIMERVYVTALPSLLQPRDRAERHCFWIPAFLSGRKWILIPFQPSSVWIKSGWPLVFENGLPIRGAELDGAFATV
jgi:hypothetical protein